MHSNPLLLDPTRTGFQRKKLEGAVRARFQSLKRKLWQLIVRDDALGLTTNANPEGHNQYWNPDGPSLWPAGEREFLKERGKGLYAEAVMKGQFAKAVREAGLEIPRSQDPEALWLRDAAKRYPSGHKLIVKRFGDTVDFDFELLGRGVGTSRKKLGKGTLSALKDMSKVAKKFHDAGFKVGVEAYDTRRQRLYRKQLTRIGMGPVREEGSRVVYNASFWPFLARDDALGLTVNANPEGHNQYWNPDEGIYGRRVSKFSELGRGGVLGGGAWITPEDELVELEENMTHGDVAGDPEIAVEAGNVRVRSAGIDLLSGKPRTYLQLNPKKVSVGKLRRLLESGKLPRSHKLWISAGNELYSDNVEPAEILASDSWEDLRRIHRGLIGNASFWHFLTSDRKLEEFKKWVRIQLGISMGESEPQEDFWLKRYINETYQKAVARAYDGHKPLPPTRLSKEAGAAYQAGGRAEFLRKAFWHPVSSSRVKALASQTMEEMKGLSEEAARKLTVELANGMIAGESPYKVGARLNRVIDGISNKGVAIAATRTVAAHNEGFLDSLELMGFKNVKVAVEWSTSGLGTTKKGNPSPCKLCAPLNGIVLTVEEAHGLLPRHPHCKCTFRPANVGESKTGQKRAQHSIQTAIRASVQMERKSTWPGATKHIASRRPTTNANPEGHNQYWNPDEGLGREWRHIGFVGSSGGTPEYRFKPPHQMDREFARKRRQSSYLGKGLYVTDKPAAKGYAKYEGRGTQPTVRAVYARGPLLKIAKYQGLDNPELAKKLVDRILPKGSKPYADMYRYGLRAIAVDDSSEFYHALADHAGGADKVNRVLASMGYSGIIDESSEESHPWQAVIFKKKAGRPGKPERLTENYLIANVALNKRWL